MKEMLEGQNKLLYKKITGEIKQSEEIEFLNWLNESMENELLFRRMQDTWEKDQFVSRVKG